LYDEPRISVAMPVRDGAPWLRESVESLLAQSERRFELIAVDDGSVDASRDILESFASADSRIRILETSREHRGIVAALNLALEAARGPYLARMDADDISLRQRLSAQLAALESDPSLFGVTCSAEAFPADSVTDGMRAYVDWQNSLVSAAEIARDRFVESSILHPTVLLRTAAVRDVLGGWHDAAWPEDWDFFLRAFGAGQKIARVPEVLFRWRQHDRQLTRSHPRYSMESLLQARATYLARYLAPVEQGGRRVFVLGAGPVGKALAKALARCGLVADGIVDVDPRKIGGVVRGAGHRWRVVAHSALGAMTPRPFAVSAVAGGPARARIRAELGKWGWKEGDDFVVAA
jgi:glycosyltransferase involved in cell wall biosynthesis